MVVNRKAVLPAHLEYGADIFARLFHGFAHAHALRQAFVADTQIGERGLARCLGTLFHFDFVVTGFTLLGEFDKLDVREASHDVAGHQAAKFVIFVFQGREQLVGSNLSTQVLIRIIKPLAVDLPALVHVSIHLVEEILGFLQEVIRYVEFEQLIGEGDFENHRAFLNDILPGILTATCGEIPSFPARVCEWFDQRQWVGVTPPGDLSIISHNPKLFAEVDVLITIPELLNEPQVAKIKEILEGANFVDGKLTAGMAAERVKKNQELEQVPEIQQRINRILMASIGHNARFRSFALPNRMADFIVARYQPGMHYGDHVDDPIMGGGKFRTDVSMTVFLNDPKSYEGGELVIRTPFGDQKVKLEAGSAVVYPSSSVHQVADVTSGERLVALTWMQSFVRNAAQRELLFELDQAREHLLNTEPDSDHAKAVDRSYANLLRMWADV